MLISHQSIDINMYHMTLQCSKCSRKQAIWNVQKEPTYKVEFLYDFLNKISENINQAKLNFNKINAVNNIGTTQFISWKSNWKLVSLCITVSRCIPTVEVLPHILESNTKNTLFF